MTTQSKLNAQAEAIQEQKIADQIRGIDELTSEFFPVTSKHYATLKKIAAELRSAARAEQSTAFHPEMGWLIDCASPSELAAYDQGCAESQAAVLAILDGKDTGVGACNEPWASLRARLLALVAARAEVEGQGIEKGTCTLCAAVESPGFYTGCMIQDGACQSNWSCDGKGNLTRPVLLAVAPAHPADKSRPVLIKKDGGLISPRIVKK